MRTALDRYALLEARGTYFDGRSARPVEVVVKFGEATLMLLRPDGTPFAHWALAALRALRDTGGPGQMVLVPDQASEERLNLTDPDMIGAVRAVCPDLDRHAAPPGTTRRVLMWGGGAIASVLLIVFVLIPAIAGQLATLIPPAREEALGRAVLRQIATMFGGFGSDGPTACRSPAGDRALARMLGRLEPHAGSYIPIKVDVLDVDMVNAFAVPGGHVVLFRGLLEAAESPEEVAGVLAHEIGHVVNRDPTRLALRSAGSVGILGLLLGDFAGGAFVLVLAEQLIAADYSREAEAAADRAAHRIMRDAQLPLGPFAAFFERLMARHGSGGGLMSHLATHPELAGRARDARDADTIRGSNFRPVLEDQDWVALRNICDG